MLKTIYWSGFYFHIPSRLSRLKIPFIPLKWLFSLRVSSHATHWFGFHSERRQLRIQTKREHLLSSTDPLPENSETERHMVRYAVYQGLLILTVHLNKQKWSCVGESEICLQLSSCRSPSSTGPLRIWKWKLFKWWSWNVSYSDIKAIIFCCSLFHYVV